MATRGTNVMRGSRPRDPSAAWPAVALVGSYEPAPHPRLPARARGDHDHLEAGMDRRAKSHGEAGTGMARSVSAGAPRKPQA